MILIIVVAIVFISLTSAIPSAQSIKSAGLETQFSLNIAYSYVGPDSNTSYLAENNARMSPISKNPSSIVFNITRIPGIQILSCDGVIELYDVQVTTDTGLIEKVCYFIGTNYAPAFSAPELSALFERVNDLADPKEYYVIVGNFHFNMTDNTSVVSTPVGSYGCYTEMPSTLGLWTAGKPNSIFVSVQRIGYITINNNSVAIYKDAASNPKSMAQLSNHNDGFLHNRLVPADKLPQTDLFHPTLD